MFASRYERLGLHRNPFGELSPEEAALAAVVEIEPWVESLGPQQAVQLVGRCGRGKTTHLRKIEHSLADASYVYIPRWRRNVAVPDAKFIIIDEIQRMPRRSRVAVFSSGRPLILATHWSVATSLRRWGYTVTSKRLGDRHHTVPIGEIVRRRWTLAAIDAAAPAAIDLADDGIVMLQRRFGCNVRAMMHYLYERVEQCLSQTSSSAEPLDDQVRIIDRSR